MSTFATRAKSTSKQQIQAFNKDEVKKIVDRMKTFGFKLVEKTTREAN